MMAEQQTTSKQADNWAPIIFGAVLGLILSGVLTAGISGWQVYRAAVTVQEADTPPAATSLTSANATPAGAYAPYNPAQGASTMGGGVTIRGSAPSATQVWGTPYATSSTAAPYATYQPSPQPQPLAQPQRSSYPVPKPQDVTSEEKAEEPDAEDSK